MIIFTSDLMKSSAVCTNRHTILKVLSLVALLSSCRLLIVASHPQVPLTSPPGAPERIRLPVGLERIFVPWENDPHGQYFTSLEIYGDFNGDSVTDAAFLVRVTDSARDTDVPPVLHFEKVLGEPGSRRPSQRAILSFDTLLSKYSASPVLLIVHSSAKQKKSGWALALVDFCDNGRLMVGLTRNLAAASAGDSDVHAPPHLVGDAITFLGRQGSGSAIYWTGSSYRWFPIEQTSKH